MKQFMVICILMESLNFPRLRMYWETNYRIPCIANAMAQKRFLSTFANLAATSDNEALLGTTNVYWKVQAIIDAVLQTCKALETEEHNSIDEQMIPFQDHVPCRQYVKNTSNPAGVKFFVRSGRSGMVYDFEFYKVKNTGISTEYKELRLGGSVVMRLVESLPQNENFKVYFDDIFTGIPLLAELKNKGFCALGVLKANRIEGAVLMSKSQVKQRNDEYLYIKR